jgi:hypothetical protein
MRSNGVRGPPICNDALRAQILPARIAISVPAPCTVRPMASPTSTSLRGVPRHARSPVRGRRRLGAAMSRERHLWILICVDFTASLLPAVSVE